MDRYFLLVAVLEQWAEDRLPLDHRPTSFSAFSLGAPQNIDHCRVVQQITINYVARSRRPAPVRCDHCTLALRGPYSSKKPVGDLRTAPRLSRKTSQMALFDAPSHNISGDEDDATVPQKATTPLSDPDLVGRVLDYGDDAALSKAATVAKPFARAASYAQKHRLLGVVPPGLREEGSTSPRLPGPTTASSSASKRLLNVAPEPDQPCTIPST